MDIDHDTAYRALLSRDRRFDGHFFVAVRTTGIYCRPVCRVRAPKASSCRFYDSAAAAEAGGFRPCLRCRPELAPGVSLIDSPDALTQAAVRLLDAGAGDAGVEAVAERVGVTPRHLRRIFLQRFGVSPVAYAQTRRLLLAKQLLQDTRLPLTEVALAAGFGSLRRFNALFQQRYHLAPGSLRRNHGESLSPVGEEVQFELQYRPPFDFASLLGFFRMRAVPGVEWVDDDCYRRCVRMEHDGRTHTGWIELRASTGRDALRLSVARSLLGALAPLLAAIRRQFDLDCDPEQISATLGSLAAAFPGLRLPGAVDPFEQAVRAVLGQQVSVAAATTLAGRIAEHLGEPISTPWPALNRLFPTAGRVVAAGLEALTQLRILNARARCIHAIASALVEGRLHLRPEVPVAAALEVLRSLPGIGEWTAQYIAMRCLSWPDAFVHTDLIIRRAFPGLTPGQVLGAAERWRPWRAYATLHLWKGATP